MDDIDFFLKEDLGKSGDITSDTLFSNEQIKAKIVAKEECILAGLAEAKKIFKRLGADLEEKVKDGEKISKGKTIAIVSGKAISILKGERLALNFICRMSGIASETKKLVEICKKINPKINIMATRKTTPGFRKYEKKAVIVGGGKPHRYGLYDAVLIKDNHIKILGNPEKALEKIKQKIKDKTIEIEIENERDALSVAKLSPDVIMLDNFSTKEAKKVIQKIKEINPEIKVEISGGINLENITGYASFADYISLGYLTHSIKSKNFSMEI